MLFINKNNNYNNNDNYNNNNNNNYDTNNNNNYNQYFTNVDWIGYSGFILTIEEWFSKIFTLFQLSLDHSSFSIFFRFENKIKNEVL